jgi:hypothetical protein
MGILVHNESGRTCALASRFLVGRAEYAQLRLTERVVSAEHASFRWTGEGWQLRDLGSRNGTWVDGRKLAAGETVATPAGSRVAFGHRDHVWKLLDDGPPEVAAVRADGKARRTADHGILALPDDDNAEATVFRGPDGRWVVESEAGERAIHDGDALRVQGVEWRVHLPIVPASTWEGTEWGPTLANVALHFQVSRNEEHVDVTVKFPGGQHELPARAHHYTLLTLARLRQEDAKTDLPEPEQGWVYQDELTKMLGCTPNHLNVSIYRIRRELASVDVVGAAGVVERRSGSGQVRLGVRAIEVVQL